MNPDYTAYLTPKQQLFCDEYMIDRNATRAALRAGYSGATALNGRLMRTGKIMLQLQQRMAGAAEKAMVNHDMVLKELCKIAFGNMGNYFGADGRMKPMHELTDDVKAALWSVSGSDAGSGGTADGEPMKIRMYNKLSALDKIAKHLNFYGAQTQKPETVYVYLDKDHLTEDDWFDDEKLQEEIRAEKMLKKKQEARTKKEEEKQRRAEEEKAEQERQRQIDEDFLDDIDQDHVACDNAGIPYDEEKLYEIFCNDNRLPDGQLPDWLKDDDENTFDENGMVLIPTFTHGVPG